MKVVLLVDGSIGNFERLIELVGNKKSLIIDTETCDEVHEYNCLSSNIEDFTRSDNEVMLIKFSGRESVIKNLGEERPEMIVCLSYNKNSKYYAEQPINTFLDLITVFEKGDYINVRT